MPEVMESMTSKFWQDLDDTAKSHAAFVASDGRGFQRVARVLQSLWRESMCYPIGSNRGQPLGSRLPTQFAEETLANYLTPAIREVVRETLAASSDRLIAAPRIYDNLLSSQPLCFNLFGEMKRNLDLATSVFRDLRPSSIEAVTDIQFEFSPGRSKPRFTRDRSALDVFVQYDTQSGERGFLGIEVKYHENLGEPAAPHRDRYDEIADQMRCFGPEGRAALRQAPLQQLWRDHLLVGSARQELAYAEGTFVLVYPAGNSHCRAALQAYRRQLVDSSSFDAWTLEEIIAVLSQATPASWVREFRRRYLDVDAIGAG